MSTIQKESLSPAELYAVEFQRGEPAYFTQIPNIIDHLTYQFEKDGVKETRRLSVYAKELYRILRMIASDHGKCWQSTESLAEIIGCSTGKVSQAKNELLMPMDQLENNPLILERQYFKTNRSEDGHTNPVPVSIKTIVNIWGWNSAFMATRKYQNQYGRDSRREEPTTGNSHNEEPLLDGYSCGERNNNPCLLNPICDVQQPTANADSVVFKSPKKQKECLELPLDKQKALNWMVSLKCNPKVALDLVKKYPVNEIELASTYLIEKKKKTRIDNIWGYFISVIEGRYWLREKRS